MARKCKQCKAYQDLLAFDTGHFLIAEERQRQMVKEGWTPQHDDQHDNGEIALAAVAYASPFPVKVRAWIEKPCGCRSVGECFCSGRIQRWIDAWPWDGKFDKRKKHSRVRQLIIAGALIAAEIDRLNRRPPQ